MRLPTIQNSFRLLSSYIHGSQILCQIIFYTIERLAWEPSVAYVAYSYLSRLPAFGRKLRFDLFFPTKVDPLNLESQNQAQNIPWFSQGPQ